MANKIRHPLPRTPTAVVTLAVLGPAIPAVGIPVAGIALVPCEARNGTSSVARGTVPLAPCPGAERHRSRWATWLGRAWAPRPSSHRRAPRHSRTVPRHGPCFSGGARAGERWPGARLMGYAARSGRHPSRHSVIPEGRVVRVARKVEGPLSGVTLRYAWSLRCGTMVPKTGYGVGYLRDMAKRWAGGRNGLLTIDSAGVLPFLLEHCMFGGFLANIPRLKPIRLMGSLRTRIRWRHRGMAPRGPYHRNGCAEGATADRTWT